MPEVFAWGEGTLYVVTGTTTATVAYATDVNATMEHGVDNYRTLDGVYHNRFTGRRVDVSIGALYGPDNTGLFIVASAETAVHLHLKHANPAGGSAGYVLWSGAIDRARLNGREGGMFAMGLDYHANLWSAY